MKNLLYKVFYTTSAILFSQANANQNRLIENRQGPNVIDSKISYDLNGNARFYIDPNPYLSGEDFFTSSLDHKEGVSKVILNKKQQKNFEKAVSQLKNTITDLSIITDGKISLSENYYGDRFVNNRFLNTF